ncbi:MAG: hypothetical protein M5U08_22750 [Burkholderiales bacterium]|nr:hypothetical protein [Burkholderiales bacterium]
MAATRSAVSPSRNGWCEWTMSGRSSSTVAARMPGTGTGTEKSLPLKFCTAGKRTTSVSSSGVPSKRGAATTTR